MRTLWWVLGLGIVFGGAALAVAVGPTVILGGAFMLGLVILGIDVGESLRLGCD